MKSNDKGELTADDISFILSQEEIVSLLQVLYFSREVFNQMALEMDQVGKTGIGKVYSARATLSSILYNKFNVINQIGEPISKDLH